MNEEEQRWWVESLRPFATAVKMGMQFYFNLVIRLDNLHWRRRNMLQYVDAMEEETEPTPSTIESIHLFKTRVLPRNQESINTFEFLLTYTKNGLDQLCDTFNRHLNQVPPSLPFRARMMPMVLEWREQQ